MTAVKKLSTAELKTPVPHLSIVTVINSHVTGSSCYYFDSWQLPGCRELSWWWQRCGAWHGWVTDCFRRCRHGLRLLRVPFGSGVRGWQIVGTFLPVKRQNNQSETTPAVTCHNLLLPVPVVVSWTAWSSGWPCPKTPAIGRCSSGLLRTGSSPP